MGTDALPPTETVSDARLQDLINLYDGQAFRGDTVLALEELQRLRHYVATCGGTDNDGRCPMHHLAGLRSSGGAPAKVPAEAGAAFAAEFKREPASPSDCAWMNGYTAGRRAPEPSEQRKVAARDLHYRLIDHHGLENDPTTNSIVRKALERLAGIAPEPRDEPLPPCSTCGGETVPFCTSCGYTTTKDGKL